MAHRSGKGGSESDQFHKFRQAAQELGCDEDEAHFEEKLKEIARHKPAELSKVEGKPSKKGTNSGAK